MEKKHRFSVWYVILGVWVVLLIHNMLSSMLAVQTIPYSEFLKLLNEDKVAEVAISANQIQGRLKSEGGEEEKGQLFRTGRVDPEPAPCGAGWV